MTDRELLELAAKAAGVNGFVVDAGMNFGSDATPKVWNPLADDGDALRLAVKLGLWLHIGKYDVGVHGSPVEEACGKDPYAATRRAIVRAAAEIGKATP
ncbi:MAG TPA: hypothetical protein VFM48_07700 [Aquabacterium sp.]|nr:hypothetical protein [Aquabacterium sp.]